MGVHLKKCILEKNARICISFLQGIIGLNLSSKYNFSAARTGMMIDNICRKGHIAFLVELALYSFQEIISFINPFITESI